MDESKRLSQPLATLYVQSWQSPGEIHSVFGAQRSGFVQKLEFWCKIRDAIRRSTPESCKWTTNLWITPEEPPVIDGIDNHKLDHPGLSFVRTAPDIMDIRIEKLASFPLSEWPGRWKYFWVSSLDIPAIEKRANFLLITSEDLHINVPMFSCVFSKKEIEGPSASDPPGN
jgi:hypothetical protein